MWCPGALHPGSDPKQSKQAEHLKVRDPSGAGGLRETTHSCFLENFSKYTEKAGVMGKSKLRVNS